MSNYFCWGNFRMTVQNKKAAFIALRDALGRSALDSQQKYNFASRFVGTKTFEGMMAQFRWKIETDDGGNVISIADLPLDYEDASYDCDALDWFKVIAPYVESGSQIVMRGDDRCFYCLYFDGEKCTEYEGQLVFPGMPGEPTLVSLDH